MKRGITPEQNARAEGRDCAVEWDGPSPEEATPQERRERFRAKMIREFESGSKCSLCAAGTDREDFLRLLGEWDRGFAKAERMLYGSAEDRAAAVREVSVRASALCSLLGITNILPEAARLGNLRTCAHLADEVADDLLLLVGGEA